MSAGRENVELLLSEMWCEQSYKRDYGTLLGDGATDYRFQNGPSKGAPVKEPTLGSTGIKIISPLYYLDYHLLGDGASDLLLGHHQLAHLYSWNSAA
jgi:hypothetical protein